MFAVIKTGGKQYKVTEGDVLKLEKISGEAGEKITLDNVLMVSDGKDNVTVGSPLVKDVTVQAEVLEQKRDTKIIIFKKKRRKNYRRKNGHRQAVTMVRITGIGSGTAKKEAPKKVVAKKPAKSTEKKEA